MITRGRQMACKDHAQHFGRRPSPPQTGSLFAVDWSNDIKRAWLEELMWEGIASRSATCGDCPIVVAHRQSEDAMEHESVHCFLRGPRKKSLRVWYMACRRSCDARDPGGVVSRCLIPTTVLDSSKVELRGQHSELWGKDVLCRSLL